LPVPVSISTVKSPMLALPVELVREALDKQQAALATAPAVEGLTAEHPTGIGPAAAARHVGGIERLAVERLAGLPARPPTH